MIELHPILPVSGSSVTNNLTNDKIFAIRRFYFRIKSY
jgi:hypothetical protein